MEITRLDHLVLTVKNIDATVKFYTELLGMRHVIFEQNRNALQFGLQKINLHQVGKEFEPKAQHPTAGSADLCFLTSTPLEEVVRQVRAYGIEIEEGPVKRAGALGELLSVYLRDPDLNLIEIANLLNG
ncbi:MAG: VOC family protein [Caldilineaceae bacterium]